MQQILISKKRSQRPKIVLFHEEELLGSEGTILANNKWISDNSSFFIIYADNYTNIDLNKMWKKHMQNSTNFSLGVFKTNNPSECGIVEVENGIVKSFVEKPKNPKPNLAAAGIYIMNKDLFSFLSLEDRSKKPLDLGFDLFPKLISQMKIYEIKENILDIGTIESYNIAQELQI